LDLITSFGAVVEMCGPEVRIHSNGKWETGLRDIHCGESGLLMRMVVPLLALKDQEFLVHGQGSLEGRPMEMMEEPMRRLRAVIETKDGLPPIRIRGPIHGAAVTLDGSLTSQFLTGLLMALPLCLEDSRLTILGLASRPYVQMTISVLNSAGVYIFGAVEDGYLIVKGMQRYLPMKTYLPGDWSASSFHLVAGAIAGSATVRGLDLDSNQADKAVIEALEDAGAFVTLFPDIVFVESTRKLKGFKFDATHCPDLFPPLTVLALNCKGESRIKGVHRLPAKESNRAKVLRKEFKKLGGKIKISGDELVINGSKLKGGEADPHGDHRIAMALAVAALTSKNGITIKDDDCVKKSYPNFFQDLDGMMLSEENECKPLDEYSE
jgi:3-phosphoshikimate 1-carboxyvinyltransferase